MIQESISTLRFGLTACSIKLKQEKQLSTNIQDDTARLEKFLISIQYELEQMRSKGMHGYMNEDHPTVTRDQFISNFRELEVAKNRLYSEKNSGSIHEQL